MMFNKFIIYAVVALAAVSQSCSKKLDLKPLTQLGSDNIYQSKDRATLALLGVYDAAQSGFYDPLNGTAIQVRGYPFGAASVMQSEMRGEDMVNIAQFYQITYAASYTNVSPNNVNMWSSTYLLINKANLAIEGFGTAAQNNILTEALAKQYEGEARFLRALAHHELVVHFARPYADGQGNQLGIPVRNYAVNSTAALDKVAQQPRDLVSAVYTQILEDLDYAEANLLTTFGGSAPENRYRATKAAAIALKMRVKMHMQDWQGVKNEGNKLLPSSVTPTTNSLIGPYGLTPVTNPWNNNQSLSVMFAIKHDAADNVGTNATLARMFQSTTAGARGLVAISPIIWNQTLWLCDDLRRGLAATGSNALNTQSYFTTKYKDIVNQSDNVPIIRFEEVVLMQAEAEARLASGVSPSAVDLLNAVRNRAINTASDQYAVASFASKNALIAAILMERRIEFLAEGKRWADIHRLVLEPAFGTDGIPAKVSTGFGGLNNYSCASGNMPSRDIAAIPYSDYRFIWPIPLEEIVVNPAITQNPNY